jgi:hypothetical protein
MIFITLAFLCILVCAALWYRMISDVIEENETED